MKTFSKKTESGRIKGLILEVHRDIVRFLGVIGARDFYGLGLEQIYLAL